MTQLKTDHTTSKESYHLRLPKGDVFDLQQLLLYTEVSSIFILQKGCGNTSSRTPFLLGDQLHGKFLVVVSKRSSRRLPLPKNKGLFVDRSVNLMYLMSYHKKSSYLLHQSRDCRLFPFLSYLFRLQYCESECIYL